jgi:hypothetical protein
MGSLELENFACNLPYLFKIELKAGELKINYRKFRKTNLDDGRLSQP